MYGTRPPAGDRVRPPAYAVQSAATWTKYPSHVPEALEGFVPVLRLGGRVTTWRSHAGRVSSECLFVFECDVLSVEVTRADAASFMKWAADHDLDAAIVVKPF